MDGPSQNLLARPGLAGNKHGSRRWRDLLDDAHHVLHDLGAANQLANAPGLAQLPRQRGHLLAVASLPQSAVEQGVQDGSLQGLFDVPEGARFNGGNRAFFTALAGNDDGWNGFQFLAQTAQQREPVHARQLHVGDQNGGAVTRKVGQGVFGAGDAEHVESPLPQQRFVAEAGVFLVLDNQDAVSQFLDVGQHGNFSRAYSSNLSAGRVNAKLRSLGGAAINQRQAMRVNA